MSRKGAKWICPHAAESAVYLHLAALAKNRSPAKFVGSFQSTGVGLPCPAFLQLTDFDRGKSVFVAGFRSSLWQVPAATTPSQTKSPSSGG